MWLPLSPPQILPFESNQIRYIINNLIHLTESWWGHKTGISLYSGTKEVGIIVNNAANIDKYWRGRKDSNPQPSDPKSDALSS